MINKVEYDVADQVQEQPILGHERWNTFETVDDPSADDRVLTWSEGGD